MSSREHLDMENMKTANNLSFNQQKGCFLQRWTIALIVLVAALLVIVVGLLVGYLTPCQSGYSPLDNKEELVKPLPYVLLPRSVVPEHYDVELQPFILPGNFTFNGKVRILIRITEDTHNVTVHVNELVVDESSVALSTLGGGAPPVITSQSNDEEREFHIMHMEKPLKAGQQLELRMKFTGTLNDHLAGFYRSSYKDSEGEKRWLATTQFQPTDARKAFPCFDEPALKATFNITLVRWANMTSASNMPIINSEDRGDGWVADYFQQTVKMSTYLLAFIVSDFKSAGTPKFSVWSRSNVLNTTSYALEVGPKMLEFYENFFNIKYPLPKTDLFAIPDFNAGAMENWGLITFRETALLHDRRYSSAANKQRVAVVISHELAHQWFGNLVTMKWWDDLWLNEGFASYVEYLGVAYVHPEWRMDDQFVLDELQDVLELDSLKTSHSISVPVRHPDEINEIFDRISYGKGASLIRMMKFFLGDESFRSGLTTIFRTKSMQVSVKNPFALSYAQICEIPKSSKLFPDVMNKTMYNLKLFTTNYLNDKKFSNAVQDELWEHMTTVQKTDTAIDVKSVMDSWTLQTGYPVITFTRNYNRNTATVQQAIFLLDNNGTNNTGAVWQVPLTFTDGLNPNWEPTTKMWLSESEGTITGLPGPNFWLLGNVKQVGYYRVNYDTRNWRLLIKQLQADHSQIHIINRAQILDDALNLARAGVLTYGIAMNTTLYMNQELDYLPWKAVLNSFNQLDILLGFTSSYGKWKRYVTKQLEPAYNTLGWKEEADENILTTFMRLSINSWMCRLDHKDCTEKALSLFEQWKEDPDNLEILSPNIRSLVYCVGIRKGGEEVWDFMWEQFKSAIIASEKEKFLQALSCAHEPWLLHRFLNWSLSENVPIRRQEGSDIIKNVGSKRFGRDMTFNFIREKWNTLFEKYGRSFFSIRNIVKSVTASLNTKFDLYQLKEFYSKQKNKLGTSKRAFEQCIENTEGNIKWMESNYADIDAWLTSVENM